MIKLPDEIDLLDYKSRLARAHFLAQCAHESQGFTKVVEDLNYSADRLREVFPKYFPTMRSAQKYAHKPEDIANRVYANRNGNGNEASGDGWVYRGRGYLGLTGKRNYFLAGQAIGDDLVRFPDMVSEMYPLRTAAWFFDVNGIWDLCERGDTDADIIRVTKKVNGGTNGLDDRIRWFKKLYSTIV